jgi:hypothetical protein
VCVQGGPKVFRHFSFLSCEKAGRDVNVIVAVFCELVLPYAMVKRKFSNHFTSL